MRVIQDILPVGRLMYTSAQPVQARTHTGCCTTECVEGLTLAVDNDIELPKSDVLLPVLETSTRLLAAEASGLEPRREQVSSEAVELFEI